MWKKSLMVILLSGTLAACNNGIDEETPMNSNEQGASDVGTPYDNGTDGINNDSNGSDRGLNMDEDNANIDTPIINQGDSGNNGATSNGGNNMNGAGGNHGESGNNTTNDNNGTTNRQGNIMDPIDDAADRIVDDGKDIVDDVRDDLEGKNNINR